MGLDMYLSKAKRVEGASVKDIDMAEEYFGWLLRSSKYADSTLKSWCGVDKDEVNMELVDAYRSEYQNRYYAWDREKEYKHLGLWDGVAYWRKANQIHRWFVENVQGGVDDCGTYEVTREDLQELLDCCIKVKDASHLVKGNVKNGMSLEGGEWKEVIVEGEIIEDPSVANELLPTGSGFFFGSTEYDRWYLDDVEYTIKAIEDLLATTDFRNEIVAYTASW